MSVDDALTDEDKNLLEQLDEEIEDAETASEYEEVARDLKSEFFELQTEFRQFQNTVQQRFDELEHQIETADAGNEENYHPIQYYANIPEDERELHLSRSEQIAVSLHTNWKEIAWKIGDSENRRFGVDSKTKANAKYNPSQLKHRLKQYVDKDLQSNEVYRGLQRLAKLSGGSEHVEDGTGRVHVMGGIYNYQERPTPDNDDIVRVLWRNGE